MLSTLYISLPSKADAAQGEWVADPRQFALTDNEGKLQQQGELSLRELREFVTQVHQVVLLLAAADVSLLQVQVPPLSAGKLRAALPNLVEEQLMGDPADVVLVSSPVQDGACTVAVVDKAWLESAATAVGALGAKRISAFPLSQTLEVHADAVSVMLTQVGGDAIELAVRAAELEGFGLSLAPGGTDALAGDPAAGGYAVATEVLQALHLFVPTSRIVLYVPASLMALYQRAFESDPAIAVRAELRTANWQSRIAGMAQARLDLMGGLEMPNMNRANWRAWQWPLALAGLVMLINTLALNVEWLKKKSEARSLSESLTLSFRASYPKETVVRAPLEQMQQKISMSRRLAGQSAPDDFVVLASQFAQTWDRLMLGGVLPQGSSIASLEYRERGLIVKTKAQGTLPLDQLRSALAEQSLTLSPAAEGVLQIKPANRNEK